MLPADKQSLQGNYLYVLDGNAVDIDEDFRIERLAGSGTGAYRVTGRRSVRSGETSLNADGLMLDGELIEAGFEWRDDSGIIAHQYQRQATWQFDDSSTDLPPGALLFGLLRVFTGPLLLRILESGGSSAVISPSLAMDRARESLLGPSMSSRTVSSHGAREWLSGDRPTKAAALSFEGGPYGEASQCWLDQHGLLLGYDWKQQGVGLWQVRLSQGSL